MAKSRKTRAQRKKQKERELRQQLRKSGYSKEQIKKKSTKELYNDYNRIENQRKIKEQKEQVRKEKARKQRADLHRKKVLALEEQGHTWARFLPEGITRKIKLSDIESGNVSHETYPQLFEKYDTSFDYDKKYELPEGVVFYVAFRDYACNCNIRDIIKDQKQKSPEQLLKELAHWNSQPKTYNGTSGTSSGSAGDMVVMIGKQGAVRHTQLDAMTRNRSKKLREHDGEYKGFQSIKLRDSVFNKEVSLKEILVIATSIMPNITEEDRKNFYLNLYNGLRHVPEIQEQLPKPE